MAKTATQPGFKRGEGERIVLCGAWVLLVDTRQRRRLERAFAQLDVPDDACWDLHHLDAFDSTGAAMLWWLWDGRLPDDLDCSDDQRRLFEWVAATAPLDVPAHHGRGNALERLGRGAAQVLKTAGGLLLLVGQLLVDSVYCVRHPRLIPWQEISANIRHIGATAMLLLGSIGFVIGAVMTIQVGLMLQQFHTVGLVISMMATAVPREMGAMLTGLLMAARTGSAMTASIGAMRITEEYSALEALGVSPSLRLALPRVIGAAIAMPLLVVWVDVSVALGSAVAAQAQLGINHQLFLAELVQQVRIVNFWIGIGKGALFGVVIAVVGCYFGMTSRPDTESMSQHTTLSVVTSVTAVLLLDAVLGASMTRIGLL